jgi:hypothetical protein
MGVFHHMGPPNLPSPLAQLMQPAKRLLHSQKKAANS